MGRSILLLFPLLLAGCPDVALDLPVLTALPDSVDFGMLGADEVAEAEVAITNQGPGAASIFEVGIVEGDVFGTEVLQEFVLEEGEIQQLTLSFDGAASPGLYVGTLEVSWRLPGLVTGGGLGGSAEAPAPASLSVGLTASVVGGDDDDVADDDDSGGRMKPLALIARPSPATRSTRTATATSSTRSTTWMATGCPTASTTRCKVTIEG